MTITESKRAWLLFGAVGGGGLAVVAMIFWVGTFIWQMKGGDALNLPLIIITGVVFLLIVLGLLTFVFSLLGLANEGEALGLPSGSVRAVIALMLLVIFAIVAIFLYSDIAASGRVQTIRNVKEPNLVELRKQLNVILVEEEKLAPAPAATPALPPAAAEKEYTVRYLNPASRAAEDLAKQLIVLLGTLVTAVSSFYFASSSIAAATKQQDATGGPDAKIVTPRELKPNTAGQPLTITGTNLRNSVGVKLTFGNEDPIIAEEVSASDTKVECKVTTKADSKPGPWTVVVSDNANNNSEIPGSVTIANQAG